MYFHGINSKYLILKMVKADYNLIASPVRPVHLNCCPDTGDLPLCPSSASAKKLAVITLLLFLHFCQFPWSLSTKISQKLSPSIYFLLSVFLHLFSPAFPTLFLLSLIPLTIFNKLYWHSLIQWLLHSIWSILYFKRFSVIIFFKKMQIWPCNSPIQNPPMALHQLLDKVQTP